jgi:hypothetical protein
MVISKRTGSSKIQVSGHDAIIEKEEAHVGNITPS